MIKHWVKDFKTIKIKTNSLGLFCVKTDRARFTNKKERQLIKINQNEFVAIYAFKTYNQQE